MAARQRIIMRHLKCDVCSSFSLVQTRHVRRRRLEVAVCANIRYLHSCIMIGINELLLREGLMLYFWPVHSHVPCVAIQN
jgi:hypothetical protein